MFLPTQINITRDMLVTILMTDHNMILCYFDLKRDAAFAYCAPLATLIRRSIFYNEPVEELVVAGFTSMLFLACNICFIHLIITKVGMIYVDATVLQTGNTQVLDNLEEGVVILEESSHEILYFNEAARGIKNK